MTPEAKSILAPRCTIESHRLKSYELAKVIIFGGVTCIQSHQCAWPVIQPEIFDLQNLKFGANKTTSAFFFVFEIHYGKDLAWSGLDFRFSDPVRALPSLVAKSRFGNSSVSIHILISGELHSTLDGHEWRIWALRWNPSGDLLLSASGDESTIVWEEPTKTRSTKYQKKQQFDFHSGWVTDVDWISDDTFTSCSLDKTIKVCRVGSDRLIRTYTGHTNCVWAVRYDPFSKRLASCSSDASIKIWSLSEDEPVHTFKQHLYRVNKVRWSPLGSILASASLDTTVRVWDGKEGKELAVLNGHTKNVYSLAFSPNGQFIASGSWDESVFLWAVNTGQPVTFWKGNNGEVEIRDVAFNRTGEKLAACTSKGALIIMDIRFLKRGHDDSLHPLRRMGAST